MHKINGTQVKRDLSDVIIKAITEYATSTKGIEALGSRTAVLRVPNTNTVQVHVSTAGGPMFFEVAVKQAFA